MTRVQVPGPLYRQFGFMPEMKVHIYYNSQKSLLQAYNTYIGVHLYKFFTCLDINKHVKT